MGGFGSGKSYWKKRPKKSSKLFTSNLNKLCIPELVKRCTQFPEGFIWNKQIYLIVNGDTIHLFGLNGKQLCTNIINVAKTACYYGGYRFFGLCPYCSTRVRDLYFYETLFACRHCFQMTYYSRHTTLYTRLLLKQKKISKKINNDVKIKPKWMRKRTFNRLNEQYSDLEEKVEIAYFYCLRNNYSVDKLFAKYGCSLAAAEAMMI